MEREITIIIGEDGVIKNILASADLKDISVSIIDKCTDNPNEFDEATLQEEEIYKKLDNNKVVTIF